MVYVDGLPVKGLVDMGADVIILTETEALWFTYWKFLPSPSINGVGSQQDTQATVWPVYWKDLDGNQGSFPPKVANVPCNLSGRDILEDIGVVDDHEFFDDIVTHDKIVFQGYMLPPPHTGPYPQI